MAQTCPQCQSEASDEADHCPNCGAALEPARLRRRGLPTAGPPPGGVAAAGGSAAGAAASHVRRAALQVRRRPVVAG